MTANTHFSVRENLLGLGARTEEAVRQTYRLVGGVKGDLGGDFNYEVAVNYSRLSEKTKLQGNLNIQRFQLANNAVRDPNSGNINPGSATRAANCAAIGVPDDYLYQHSSSLPYQSGGNPQFQAEKSDSYTVGGVVTPRFVPGLSILVDYYTIKVKNTISAVGAQTIINQCVDLTSTSNPYCALFQRAGASGGPNGEIPGQIIENSLLVGPVNFAKLSAQGIDTEIAYRHQIGNLDRFDTRFTYTHVINQPKLRRPRAERAWRPPGLVQLEVVA